MRKIPTLFVRNGADLSHVTERVHPDCEWVLAGQGVPTRKFDGTCMWLDEEGSWWARREVKRGKLEPAGFLPVQTDPVTGKQVGWQPARGSSFVKFLDEALREGRIVDRFVNVDRLQPGTYELCGPKINGNPDHFVGHHLVRHGFMFDADKRLISVLPKTLTYGVLRDFFTSHRFDWEGIVWHHPDGRMAKLKKRDFRVH